MISLYRKRIITNTIQQSQTLNKLGTYPVALQTVILTTCTTILKDVFDNSGFNKDSLREFEALLIRLVCHKLSICRRKRFCNFSIHISKKEIQKLLLTTASTDITTRIQQEDMEYSITYELPILLGEIHQMVDTQYETFQYQETLDKNVLYIVITKYIQETFIIFGEQTRQKWESFIDTLLKEILDTISCIGNGFYYISFYSEGNIPCSILRSALKESKFSLTGLLPIGRRYSSYLLSHVSYHVILKATNTISIKYLLPTLDQCKNPAYQPEWISLPKDEKYVCYCNIQTILQPRMIKSLMKKYDHHSCGHETILYL